MKRQTPAIYTAESLPAESSKPFRYADYVSAESNLTAALQGPCFYATLIGNSGMGKTCLLREVSAKLDRPRHNLLYFSSSRASVSSVSRLIAKKLHVSPHYSYLETVHAIAEAIESQNTHFVLWIDEADQLEPSMLQEVRMLAESDSNQLFTVVLSGLPQLLTSLNTPRLFPLKRRITTHLQLSGLRRNELQAFLEHRFGALKAKHLVGADDEFFERTAGTPALIDNISRQALEMYPDIDINSENIRAILDTAGL